MKTNYVLVDYENVQVKSLALLKGEHFRVRVFIGPHNTKLPVDLVLAMHKLGEKAEYVVLETPGRNALDFHIAYYLGELVTAEPSGFFHIISRDTGFDPLIEHLRKRKILVARSPSIEKMPCFGISSPATQESMAAPSQQKSDIGKSSPGLEELINAAVDDLIKRKAAKPRTPRTLLSTIHARCGKDTPTNDVDDVYEALVNRGYVKVEGTKVSYALPVSLPNT